MLVPRLKMRKIMRLKIAFYIIGALYMLGNTWIFYFLKDNPASMLKDIDALKVYLSSAALNFDYLVWDSYDLYGIFFSTLEAVLYFALGYFVDKKRKTTVKIFWAMLFFCIVLPFIYVYLISGTRAFSSLWLQKNTILFAAGIFMGAGLTIASTSHHLWGSLIWN